jgi:flagellar biosynthesis protein
MPDGAPEEGGVSHPRQRATALGYQPGDRAPTVLATGAGLIAQRIIDAAREAGVPVRSDPALVEALAVLDVGHEVPQAMWVVVAETLAWAYRLDGKARRSARADAGGH